MLDLVTGSYDLSRRAKLYRLHGLSFREYLNFSLDLELEPISFSELLQGHPKKHVAKILTYFEEYLQRGYYPFLFEDFHSYHEKVSTIIEKTILKILLTIIALKHQTCNFSKKS